MVQAIASSIAQVLVKTVMALGAISAVALLMWLTVAPLFAAADGTNWWLAAYLGYFMIWLGWVARDELVTA